MKIIGLTGGIASGKSTVSNILKQNYNLPIIDADLLSREAVEQDSPGLQKIEETFGSKMLLPDGRLNRSLLGELISNDTEMRNQLNAILHPAIAYLYEQKLKAYRAEGVPLIIYDCPLLIEANLTKEVDEILLIITDVKTRINRIKERDGLDEALAKKKIEIQISDEEKMAAAHTIIYNNGTVEELEKALDFFVKEKLKKTCIIL